MLAQIPHARQNRFGGFSLSVFFGLFFLFSPPAHAQRQKSGFTARLINIESVTKDPFRYNTLLHNGGRQPEIYQLQAQVPEGWFAIFQVEGSQVAALRIDSGKTQNIAVEISATPVAKPGKYVIPVSAISNTDTLRLDLEAVVKGNYSLELTTPTGRLSDEITEGSDGKLQLVVKNTGTLPLEGIVLSAQSPTQWTAKFEPSKIERVDPGQTQQVSVTLSVPNKTIAGDYMTTFTGRNNYASASAAFRMTVKTSLLSGWIGVFVILLAFGLVYYLIRKYGRR
ncbi:MAG TPA: NEW3 domain-containing protein [Puia sp.]|nr:NEW3 domain-containing protein [Puia sp.]